MKPENQYDAIIIGGSYSGLAAAMAMGRALKRVLVIDSGKPCNARTPYSHNFLTQDGKAPAEIAAVSKQQVQNYDTVSFLNGTVTTGKKLDTGYAIETESGKSFTARQLIFATGINDIFPAIDGFSECWGISVLHCPYCHGYEVRNQKTGILGNGDTGYELAVLISNWTDDLTVFTNGKSTLTSSQANKLAAHNIRIVQKEIKSLHHTNGNVQHVIFENGSKGSINVIYSRNTFAQHCNIPEILGCELTDEGYIKVSQLQETTIGNVYACGDNTTKIRSVANAVAMGTTAGMMASKKFVAENF